MPYIKTTVDCGHMIEVYKYYAPNYSKKRSRGEKVKEATEAMKKVNLDHAARKLNWLISCNFGKGDLHVTLTYGGSEPDPKEAKTNLAKFHRAARAYFKKAGKEYKYIAVTEYQAKRIHHHVIMPGLPVEELQALWPHGRPRITALDANGQYSQLAEYLIKETERTFRGEDAPSKKRWSASKNLKQPKIIREVIESKKWSTNPKAPKGWYIEGGEVTNRVNEFDGLPMQFYRLMRMEGNADERKKAGKGRSGAPPTSRRG
jgi:hypothetical protein